MNRNYNNNKGKYSSSIQVLGGRGLAPRDPNGLADPYCLIGIAPSGKEFKDVNTCLKSEVKKWTLSPEWKNVIFTTESEHPIRIEVWDKNLERPDEFMGYVIIERTETCDKWVPLLSRSKADGVVSGELHIVVSKKAQQTDAAPPSKSEPHTSPPQKPPPPDERAASELGSSSTIAQNPPTEQTAPTKQEENTPSSSASASVTEPEPVPVPVPAKISEQPSQASKVESRQAELKPVLSLKAAPPEGPKPKETPRSSKHIMISYQWECQEFAKDLYNALTLKGFNVWMDIQGGMYGNIYESMARAVNNASLVIPLLTPEYEKSANCKRECELVAVRKIPMIPLKLTMFDPVGWLSTAIPAGTLWFNFSNRELQSAQARKEFERVCLEIKQLLPDAVPRMKPTVFLSYTAKNQKYAEELCKYLKGAKDKDKGEKEGKKEKHFSVKCILSRAVEGKDKSKKEEKQTEEKKGEEKKGEEKKAEDKKGDEKKEGLGSMLLQREVIEEQIRSSNVIAVILILTADFETDEDCKFEVNLAYSARKTVIPTIWQRLKGYPPKPLEFCLKTLNPVDFVKSHSDLKVKIKVDYIKKLLQSSTTTSQLTNIISDKNYIIKSVGEWNEVDVTNWLRSINLQYYCQTFRNQHVNGRVLLGLTEADLDLMKVSKLHQKIFYSKLQELYQNFNWTEVEVAEWLEGLKLPDCKEALFEAGIDGKSLLVLTEHDLASFGLSSRVLQSRLMLEIYLLKLQKAKVPEKEIYRFSVLKDVLLPCPSDELGRLRFSPDMLGLMKDIVANVDSHPQGLTQTGLKKFLLVLLLTAYGYKKTYPTKILWYDATNVELLALRTGFIKDLFGEDDENDDGRTKIRFSEILNLMDDFQSVSEELNEKSIYGEEGSEDVMSEFVVALRLQYVTLDNIIMRLFSLFDRMVNGVIALGELVAGLDLLIYGSYDAKYKLAFSLMDFNGDGSLSREEYAQFNKECFLPVLKDIKKHNLVNDFGLLNKHSFLYKIYDELKEELDTLRPSLLNDKFTVESYTGGAQDGMEYAYGIQNAFQVANVHCSTEGKNFDLYLASKSPSGFQLTNFYIGGNEHNCTCYLKDALVWFSEKPIDWKSYTSEFDNFTKRQFEALDENHPHKPNLFISTTSGTYSWGHQFKKPEKVAYIHIKLIRPHKSRFGFGFYEFGSDSGSDDNGSYSGSDSEPDNEAKKKGEKKEEKSEDNKEEKNKDNKEEKKKEKKEKNQKKKNHESGSESGSEDDGKEDEKNDEKKDEKENEKKDEKKDEKKEKDDDDDDDGDGDDDDDDDDANIDIEFIGFWGFPGDQDLENAQFQTDTQNLRSLLGFQRDDDDDYVFDENELMEAFNVSKMVNEYLNAVVQVADGLPLPESAGKLGVKQEEVEGVLKQLLFIDSDATSGSSHVNPGHTLIELLPIVHLFRLFMGYPPLHVLTQPM